MSDYKFYMMRYGELGAVWKDLETGFPGLRYKYRTSCGFPPRFHSPLQGLNRMEVHTQRHNRLYGFNLTYRKEKIRC